MPTETSGAAIDQTKLNTAQAAELLGLCSNTLAIWRLTKRYALPYLKVGRNIRYLRSDLEAFLQNQRVDGSVTAE